MQATPNDVALRAVAEADLELLERWRVDRDHESEYGDFMVLHRHRSYLRDHWQDNGLLDETEGTLLVTLAGEPVGAVQWHVVTYGPNTGSRALNIGISLEPSARGRGVGAAAQARLAEYLFAQTPVHRVEASTDVANRAEQRALEKAGFVREGVLRGAQFRRGAWRDMVLYSRLRSDLPAGAARLPDAAVTE
jgi:RimJ/RimL family protein N-acetyltransferase